MTTENIPGNEQEEGGAPLPETQENGAGFTPPPGDNSAQEFTPPKKRRGRPPKDPSKIKEGIPSGSSAAAKTAAKKNKYSAADAVVMGQQLVGVHKLTAMMTGIPELEISEPEGQALAGSVINVCNQYDLEIDGKTGAFIQLFATAAMIYTPRYVMIRKKMAVAKANEMAQGQMFDANGTPQTPA